MAGSFLSTADIILYRTVVCPLRLLIEIACRQFPARAMIRNTVTTYAVPRTTRIRTIASCRISFKIYAFCHTLPFPGSFIRPFFRLFNLSGYACFLSRNNLDMSFCLLVVSCLAITMVFFGFHATSFFWCHPIWGHPRTWR